MIQIINWSPTVYPVMHPFEFLCGVPPAICLIILNFGVLRLIGETVVVQVAGYQSFPWTGFWAALAAETLPAKNM